MIQKLHDRYQAGQLLAEKLAGFAKHPDAIALGLPRGGAEVACGLGTKLGLPVDVFLVRKLGVPGYEELAMGAVAMGGVQVIDPDVVEGFRLSQREIQDVVAAETAELQRRERVFRGSRPPLELRGRTVILVDDGIATGSTMRAAIAGTKRLGAAHVMVAAGVAPLATFLALRSEVDEIVCLLTPREFYAVGLLYEEFPQLTDHDVCRFLDDARKAHADSLGFAQAER
jgi:putative phosphoribosyl transferase